jgi:hypothetical protein
MAACTKIIRRVDGKGGFKVPAAYGGLGELFPGIADQRAKPKNAVPGLPLLAGGVDRGGGDDQPPKHTAH